MFQAIKTLEKSGTDRIGGDQARPKILTHITEKEPLSQSHHSKHRGLLRFAEGD